jgi:hypothetical protein
MPCRVYVVLVCLGWIVDGFISSPFVLRNVESQLPWLFKVHIFFPIQNTENVMGGGTRKSPSPMPGRNIN